MPSTDGKRAKTPLLTHTTDQSQRPYASAKPHQPITLKGKHLKTLIGFSCWHFWNAFKLLEKLSLSLDNCMDGFSRSAFTLNNGFDNVVITWWKGRLFIRLFGGKITNAYSWLCFLLHSCYLNMRHLISLSIIAYSRRHHSMKIFLVSILSKCLDSDS